MASAEGRRKCLVRRIFRVINIDGVVPNRTEGRALINHLQSSFAPFPDCIFCQQISPGSWPLGTTGGGCSCPPKRSHASLWSAACSRVRKPTRLPQRDTSDRDDGRIFIQQTANIPRLGSEPTTSSHQGDLRQTGSKNLPWRGLKEEAGS